MDIASPRQSATASISSGTALSNSIDLEGYRISALRLSAGWVGTAPMTFQGSHDNSSFLDLYDDAGAELSIASGSLSSAAHAVALGEKLQLGLGAHRYVKFRSGPSAAVVNTTAVISITAVLLPWS